MKIYNPTYSAVKPPEIDITEKKVFLATDIQEVDLEIEDSITHCFQYSLAEYDKDEYLMILSQNQQVIEALKEELEAAKIILGVE